MTAKRRAPKKAEQPSIRATSTIRDRIAGLLRLPKSRLRPNPRNWRLHPEQQRRVLRAVLDDVGVFDALLVRPVDPAALTALRGLTRGDDAAFASWAASYKGAFMLADGHMRLEEIDADNLSCLVLDIDDREEAEVLATLDPIAAMATTDTEMLSSLSEDLGDASSIVSDMVDQLMGVSRDERGQTIQVVDTTKREEEFYMSVRGPIPAQPEAIEQLRKAMNAIPGVIAEVGLVG